MKVEKEYHPNGNVKREAHYNSEGQLHGKDIWWYKNRQKCWEEDYHQGQQHGKRIVWHKNGEKCWEIDYNQGQRHGRYIWLDIDGQINYEDYYLYGEPTTKEEYEKHQLIKQLAGIK